MNCPHCTRRLETHCANQGCDVYKCRTCRMFGRPCLTSRGPKRWVPMAETREQAQERQQREWAAWRREEKS